MNGTFGTSLWYSSGSSFVADASWCRYRDPVRGEFEIHTKIAGVVVDVCGVAPGEKGAEEHYDLSDALGMSFTHLYSIIPIPDNVECSPRSLVSGTVAVAAWLNVFVRKADIVKIACIAQYVTFPFFFNFFHY